MLSVPSTLVTGGGSGDDSDSAGRAAYLGVISRDITVTATKQSIGFPGVNLRFDFAQVASFDEINSAVEQGFALEKTLWGTAPDGFGWKPRVRLETTPDGVALAYGIEAILQRSGVEVTRVWSRTLHTLPNGVAP